MATANIKAVITAEDRASSVLHNFGATTFALGQLMADGIEYAAKAIVGLGVSSVKAFEESQDLIAQTNAVLTSTGGIAGITADKVTELATAWERQTKYSDEAVRGAENILLTFTAISKDIFPDALESVLNMSSALHEDLQSASIQVGKALQDPILGITALRRVGVNFSDAQKEVVKGLVETGQKGQAQALILKELQTEFGGSAKAAGETFSGSLAKLKNQFNNVQEAVGGALVKAITPWVEKLAAFVSTDKFQAWLTQLAAKIGQYLPQWIENFQKFIKSVDWKAVGEALAAMVKAIVIAAEIIGGTIKNVITIFHFFHDDVAGVIYAVVKIFQDFYTGAYNIFSSIPNAVRSALSGLWNIIVSPFVQAFDTIRNIVDGIINKINEIPNKINSVSQSAGKAAGTALDPLNLLGHRAAGGSVSANKPYIVGEQGQELFIPNQSGTIIPNNRLGGNSTINITVPMMTGSATERRKVAQQLLKDIQDLAQMNGKSVSQMMGA